MTKAKKGWPSSNSLELRFGLQLNSIIEFGLHILPIQHKPIQSLSSLPAANMGTEGV